MFKRSRWVTAVKCLSECWSLNASQKAISVMSWVWWGFTPGRPVGRDNHRQGQSLSFPRYNFPADMRTFYHFPPFPITTIVLATSRPSGDRVFWNKNSLWKVCIQRALHVELIGYCKTKTFFKKTFWNKNFLWNVGLQYVLHVDPIGYEKASSLIAPSTDVTHRRHIWGRK